MMDRGYFGIGVVNSKSPMNIGSLWRSAHNYGAALLFTTGKRYARQRGDTTKAWRHVPLLNFTDLADLFEHIPMDCRIVGVEEGVEAHGLATFHHPERAIYLLGAEDHGLPRAALERCHEVVTIEGAERCLNVAVAGGIVMYDRWRKMSVAP